MGVECSARMGIRIGRHGAIVGKHQTRVVQDIVHQREIVDVMHSRIQRNVRSNRIVHRKQRTSCRDIHHCSSAKGLLIVLLTQHHCRGCLFTRKTQQFSLRIHHALCQCSGRCESRTSIGILQHVELVFDTSVVRNLARILRLFIFVSSMFSNFNRVHGTVVGKFSDDVLA